VADQAFGPHPRQKLDVYLPEGYLGAAQVAIFLYGGAWERGDRQRKRTSGLNGMATMWLISRSCRYLGFWPPACGWANP
jgi:hypothetical protein